MEGDWIWYQNKDGKSWCGPAFVHCWRVRSVWIYSMGEIKKIVPCKVKPYELVERDQGDKCGEENDQGGKDD